MTVPFLFPERDVEEHHEGKAENGACGSEVAVPILLGFGDHFFHDDKDHCACGKRESEGQKRLNDHYDRGADHGRDRFYGPREQAIPKAFSFR
jgi:hypothetical protein